MKGTNVFKVKSVFAAVALLMAATLSAQAGEHLADGWSGFYGGIYIGGGSGDIKGLGALAGVNATDNMGGVIGGVLTGWTVQNNDWVFGIEGDLALSNINGSINILGVAVSEKIDWSGDLRVRAGYLVNPDFLVFASGGLAFARYNIKTNSLIAGNDSATFTGWTIGGGLEANLSENVSARLEYLYTDYGSRNMFASVGGVTVSPQLHTIRAALIYKF